MSRRRRNGPRGRLDVVAKEGRGNPDVYLMAASTLKLAPVGLAAGFFGIGGGFLIVPGLMAATGMTLANAAASSLVSVVLFGAATSGSYATVGLVDGAVFGALVVGSAAGAIAGIPLAKALVGRADFARRAFAVMVLATAAYVGWRASGLG